jgi:hypothetical protein
MPLAQFVADYALSLRVDIDAHSTPLLLYKDRGFCLEPQAREPVAVVAIRNGEFDRHSDASGPPITVDPDIHENILAAAARDRVSASAWTTTAAREALKRRAGLAAVELWEKEHGRFTSDEMNEARRRVRAQLRTSRTVRRPA